MSSSYIIEPQDNGAEKKDDTLIIVVDDHNTITVDQETLQNLIMNQSNANVSVVKVGPADADTENGDITLTVDPPFASTPVHSGSAHTVDSNTLIDPFMEMDPEQLERLETALQSEEAKQILGENVTAMFDMLTVEEEQNSIKYSVKLDHCYTSRSSPSDPKPRDPLPIIDSPTSDEGARNARQYSPTPGTSKTSSPVAEMESLMKVQPKAVVKTSKPVGRPRKNTSSTPVPACNNTRLSMDVTSTPKTIGHPVSRNLSGVMQSPSGKQKGRSNDDEDEELTSSSDSFESEPSDNDSDFGPRGPRRGGVRARGGRKGLTTRGGSLAATRRRGPNKQLDMEQVRRLDMEMAAAVNAMKSPDKEEKSAGGFGIVRGRRQIKTLMGRKKEESPRIEVPSIMNEDANFEKPLQTTNQVKANLINANMIKGDMIITKPGQGRTTPKVTFVQKQMLMKPNDFKDINTKKHVFIPKGKFLNQSGTKLFTTKDGKLFEIPVTTVTKTITSSVPVVTMKGTVVSPTQSSVMMQNQTVNVQQQQSTKTSPTIATPKIKSYDIKKEKKKPDNLEISATKTDIDSNKTPEIKVADNTKKHHIKKETRKSPAYMVDTLGPALFSTPDIIRRVGSNGESKVQENVVTSLIPTTPSSVPVSSVTGTSFVQATTSTTASSDRVTIPSDIPVSEKQENLCEKLIQNEEAQPSIKSDDPDELQSTLDSTGIESEEHLLASLEVQADKHEDELLAEALLLQEELGVELAGNTTLVEQGGSVPASEPLTLNNTLIEPLIGPEQETVDKSLDMDTMITETATTSSTTTLAAKTSISMNASKETIKRPGKDDKEPIQIIRGGRIITLPPIEAPATRSKRLQIKTEQTKQTEKLDHSLAQTVQQRSIKYIETYPHMNQSERNKGQIRIRHEESVKGEETEKIEVPEVEMEEDVRVKDRKLIEEEEEKEPEGEEEIEDDDDDEEEENSDSEDDPNRLWCICKRPHNNRFMICCDVCEDWFHGKCVHVSKAMGQQMEEKGIEWVCPNCSKKKDEEAKVKQSAQNVSEKQRIQSEVLSLNRTSLGDETPSALIQTDCGNVQYSMGTQCVVCKKEARNSSIYCSDACILAHAQETLTKDKPLPGSVNSPKQGPRSSPIDPSTKSKLDARVIVLERKTGRVLSGSDAPTRANLRTWLKEHPTFEVVGTNNVSTLQLGKNMQTQATSKTGKPVLMLSGKGQTLPKMTYTRVPGSKQMILTAGNKKLTMVSLGQQQQQQSPTIKTIPAKQMYSPQSSRSPLPKNVTTRAVTPQSKQLGVSSPKQTPNTKKQELKQTTTQSKQQIVKQSPPKKPETEPIRLNVRKTLSELLSSRIKETEDLKLTDEEISDLALNIELELYKYFKDTGAKYKAKYRSLVFNIKDTKNLTLFRKIADRSLTPDAVVKLSPDAMASQELAEWREKETKHQLEMIKKNELDMMAQAKSIVVKTHKGEQIIENEGAIDHVDPKTPVQDIVTALNNTDSITSTVEDTDKDTDGRTKEEDEKFKTKEEGKRSKSIEDKRKDKDKREREKDKERRMKESTDRHRRSSSRTRHKRERDDRGHTKTREKSRERKSRDKGRRDKDREKERERTRDRDRSKIKDRHKSVKSHEGSKEKSKQKTKEKEKERHRNSENSSRSRSESKDVDKREEIEKKDDSSLQNGSSTEKSIEDRLWRHIEDEPITKTLDDGNDSDVSDREPSSTVTIKTPDINEDVERDREQEPTIVETPKHWQTVWRGFVNMVDVAKFFITAQEVSGHAKDLMDDLPDTVDVVGRISHETVWDYISKMKKTGSKEILVIRLTAANDEEKIPYITLYSYLNSRSRLGVVGNVSKNIKDFYIMPFSNQSTIPPVLLPLNGPGFEERRPHLLLGIIVRNKRKRIAAGVPSSTGVSMKLSKTDRSYTPPLLATSSKDKLISINNQTVPSASTATSISLSPSGTTTSTYQKTATTESKEKQHSVTQTTLDNLNRAHIGMQRSSLLDTAAINKIVPELSSKIDLDLDKQPVEDDGDEPYSPGQMDEEDIDMRTSAAATSVSTTTMSSGSMDNSIISSSKNSNELERKMEELNRQIEEQKQQIQNISSSFLAESTSTLPGLGLDPPVSNECEEAYSPSDPRSFTPPPPGISKFSQPILEKVSNITIPPNLQEILANVKRQESSKVDPYLPSKPGATFLTTTIASIYPNSDKYSSSPVKLPLAVSNKSVTSEKSSLESIAHRESKEKESKSTLSSLSEMDLIRKAEEELAAVAAASSATGNLTSDDLASTLPMTPVLPSIASLSGMSPPSREVTSYKTPFPEPFKRNIAPEQPKPPGLEDEDFPSFPSTPPNMENSLSKTITSRSKFLGKSGIVLSVKRKNEDRTNSCPNKVPRVKSRWGLGPSDSAD